MFPLLMPSWMICHFSSGDRSTRGFLLMLPPVFGGPKSYRIRQSSFGGEHYKRILVGRNPSRFLESLQPRVAFSRGLRSTGVDTLGRYPIPCGQVFSQSEEPRLCETS